MNSKIVIAILVFLLILLAIIYIIVNRRELPVNNTTTIVNNQDQPFADGLFQLGNISAGDFLNGATGGLLGK